MKSACGGLSGGVQVPPAFLAAHKRYDGRYGKLCAEDRACPEAAEVIALHSN
jgi:hypothetical protein